MARIVAQVRAHLPKVRILLRADSSFAHEELMHWCEENRADYLFRLARNARLLREIENQLAAAAEENGKTGRRARRFKDFAYATFEQLESHAQSGRQSRMAAAERDKTGRR
jgi:Transposase DDE domain group 1